MSKRSKKKVRRRAPLRRKDRPLRVSVERDVLTIEIGVDTLAFAALRSPFAYTLGGNIKQRDPSERYTIDDAAEFAAETKRELLAEAEDGSTLLSEVIDKATQQAIENGSIAFRDTWEDDQ